MSLPRYPQYKDSGVEWLGRLPAHWSVSPLKRHMALLTEKAEGRRWPVALENVESWSGRFVPTEGDFQGDGVAFAASDILFGKLRPYLAKVFLAARDGEAVGDFHVVRPGGALFPRYAQYQMLQRQFIDVVDGSTFGSKMPRASWESLGGMPLVVPEYEEQRSIAFFLDRETAKIDTLIAEQEKLLALLAEKRQATISHAVTRGLDPNVPMKDSGIPWLGEVPAHWEVKPLKRIARLITGMTPPTDDEENYAEDGHPWVRPEDLDESGFPSTPSRFLSAKGWGGARHVAPNASLICCIGSIGKVGFVDTCVSTNQQITSAEFSGNGRYFYYVTCAARRELELSATGNVLRILNSERLGNLFYPSPVLVEQKEIAELLDHETAKLDELASEGVRAIGLLKERRSALIAAAVTGQIDVRDAVKPEAA